MLDRNRPRGCLDPKCFEFLNYVPPIPGDKRGETSNGIENTCCMFLMNQEALDRIIDQKFRSVSPIIQNASK